MQVFTFNCWLSGLRCKYKIVSFTKHFETQGTCNFPEIFPLQVCLIFRIRYLSLWRLWLNGGIFSEEECQYPLRLKVSWQLWQRECRFVFTYEWGIQFLYWSFEYWGCFFEREFQRSGGFLRFKFPRYGGVQILDFQWRQKGVCRIGLDCISGLHLWISEGIWKHAVDGWFFSPGNA